MGTDQSHRWRPTRPNFTGLVVAVLFACWSLTPSLVPRSWWVQGAATGVLAAVGYGLGVLASHGWRQVVKREPGERVRLVAWRVLAVGGPATAVLFLLLGARWQRQIHVLAGTEPPGSAYILTALLAVGTAVTLVGTARGIRWLVRRLARPLHRWVPPRVAHVVVILAGGWLFVGVLDGVVAQAFLTTADTISRTVDEAMDPGLSPPSLPTRSGSAASLVAWEDLGSKGRTVIATGPTREDLVSFHGPTAMDPIRAYVGLRSADEDRDRARLAVEELVRAGGFDRAVVAVVLPTGTGWINPMALDALEYLHAGDTAIVAMQYSYLPSWLSYIVDGNRARDAGRLLFDEVYDHWADLPGDERPRLVVYAESLGAYGSEAAFTGVGDLRARVDGALWVGPPNFNPLWREFTAQRDPGSPERRPVFEEGRTVRFIGSRDDLAADDGWEHPRVVYLQHPSDPVVWWSANLLLRQPDWLREAERDALVPPIRWYPIVTFTQITIDLLYEHALEHDEYGHRYGTLIADAWVAILPPDGWTPADQERLRAVLTDAAR